ncbi:hypothetical protein [Hazenella coriacea]|uniref:Uncharacterized protein n=1 Tax=Hazenella coriacea TaxID=1179467 RepID=A0A4R3L8I2_9BACL|nr:hypothetical protein [Hazenella coriacea]TCS95969.1 hypothetical protein EDD58_102553 [Hazenella coriacea]
MEIPKYPRMNQELTPGQINQLTHIVFGGKNETIHDQKFDCIFVFGGTHPGCWQLSMENIFVFITMVKKGISNR